MTTPKGFTDLQKSPPTGWHPSHPNYCLLYYKRIEVSQVIGALQVINENFLNQFETIVEIGSYFGGLSLWINDHKKESTTFVSYDIDANLNQAVKNGHVLDFRIADCFSDDGKKEIINFINLPGKCLLICDGGNKNEEFNVFSKYLKQDDVIMLHDFSTDEDIFKQLGNYWQWPYGNESQYAAIEDSIEKNDLKQIDNFDDFLSTFWGVYVKK